VNDVYGFSGFGCDLLCHKKTVTVTGVGLKTHKAALFPAYLFGQLGNCLILGIEVRDKPHGIARPILIGAVAMSDRLGTTKRMNMGVFNTIVGSGLCQRRF
jgi:hypothetical protein